METETALEKPINGSAFSLQNFEHAQRVAKMLATSDLIPDTYKGKIQNVMIAMEMSNRMNISPLMVMQNLYIVKGNPGWSGQFVIGIINNSKRFQHELRFEKSGEGDAYGYTAWTTDLDGKRVDGTKIDMKMVKGENWLNKSGSKWQTMPEQMFRYRAAAFFGRIHCPDLLMGMQTIEEIIDIQPIEVQTVTIEVLQNLLDDVVDDLTATEFNDAKRIIANKEAASYNKLNKLLTSKVKTNGADNQN